MPYYFFAWDDDSIEHLDEHGVTPEEFEEIVCNPSSVGVSRSSGRPMAFGEGDDGRTLACIYDLIDDTVYPATAYEVE